MIAAYRSALAADPENLVSLNNLAVQYVAHRRYAEAESLVARAAEIGRGTPFTLNLVSSRVHQGRVAEAEAALRRYRQAEPESPFGAGLEAWLASARRDYPTSERLLREVRDGNRDSRFIFRRASSNLASEYEKQGRVSEARRILEELVEEAERSGDAPDAVTSAAGLGLLQNRYGGASEALAGVARALERHPLASMDPLDRPYLFLSYFYAQAGQVEQARRLLREYESAVPEGMRRGDHLRFAVSGALAEAERRDDAALGAYREWYREDGECGLCGLYEIGTIHERGGRADSALAAYQRLVKQPTLTSAMRLERYTLAPTYKRLGELYEARGDRRNAADYYGRFVDLWKNADPELQPAVREVRGRLAQLAREPGA